MEEKQLISAYNESGFQISRLHNHWNELNRYRESGEHLKYKRKLESIELELRYDAEMVNEEYLDKLKQINTKIRATFLDLSLRKINPMKIKTNAVLLIDELEALLMEKESMLRKIQQESGKGSKYTDPEEDSMI